MVLITGPLLLIWIKFLGANPNLESAFLNWSQRKRDFETKIYIFRGQKYLLIQVLSSYDLLSLGI